jgi:hypothetical protein
VIRRSASEAKVSGSDRASAVTASTRRPSKPPRAFRSSTARSVASTTGFSLKAIVPLREWRTPIRIGSRPAPLEQLQKNRPLSATQQATVARPAITASAASDRASIVQTLRLGRFRAVSEASSRIQAKSTALPQPGNEQKSVIKQRHSITASLRDLPNLQGYDVGLLPVPAKAYCDLVMSGEHSSQLPY